MPAQRESAFGRRRFQKTIRLKGSERLTGGSHSSGLNFQTGDEAHRRPRAAVVAGGDPRRGRKIGGYLRVQGALPRRLVVVVAVGEHHVDGELCSGGRRLEWSRGSSERAAKVKLKRGLCSWQLERVTNGV